MGKWPFQRTRGVVLLNANANAYVSGRGACCLNDSFIQGVRRDFPIRSLQRPPFENRYVATSDSIRNSNFRRSRGGRAINAPHGALGKTL